MLVEIGLESLLSDTPKNLNIDGKPYILNLNESNTPVLFSAICPHSQGIVESSKNEIWTCPFHGWTYNSNSGQSINSPQSSLRSYKIIVKHGKLFVDLQVEKKNSIETSSKPKKGPKITLVKHASLLIEWNGFNLLTDPWIEGPALFGTWIHYPPSDFTVSTLPKIDAIWISHEHTDHLHPYSLSLFDKNIPIFVPKFDDDRLVRKIKEIGFKDVLSMPSFEPFNITKSIEATSIKSSSVWNDNILFLRTGDFTTINFNDAGINLNLNNRISNVDLICSAFSWGGSAYPTNWSHLDQITKNKIMMNANLGLLKELKRMVDLFKPTYLLPIASFMALYNPLHYKYQKMKTKNSLEDVKNFFKDEKVKILDLLPGESWNGENNNIKRVLDRKKFSDTNYFYKYLKESYKKDKNKNFVPSKFEIIHDDIKKYFLSFQNTDLVNYIGEMKLYFEAYNDTKKLCSLISFKNGKMSYQELKGPVEADLSISCPGGIVEEIIKKDLSWDEAYYWCDFKRDPDVYNLAFWRLLHAPWRCRSNSNYTKLNPKKPFSMISIATMIEKGGNQVTQILEKYGLYCSGCLPSIGENIEDGCAIHGISKANKMKLIDELEQISVKFEN